VEEGAAQVVVCPEDVEVNGVLRTSFNENLGILCSRVQQGGDALRVACRLQWQTTFCQAGIERCNNVWLCACCVCSQRCVLILVKTSLALTANIQHVFATIQLQNLHSWIGRYKCGGTI
jgi:hypothetical protein